jgi:hypothetical protein
MLKKIYIKYNLTGMLLKKKYNLKKKYRSIILDEIRLKFILSWYL